LTHIYLRLFVVRPTKKLRTCIIWEKSLITTTTTTTETTIIVTTMTIITTKNTNKKISFTCIYFSFSFWSTLLVLPTRRKETCFLALLCSSLFDPPLLGNKIENFRNSLRNVWELRKKSTYIFENLFLKGKLNYYIDNFIIIYNFKHSINNFCTSRITGAYQIFTFEGMILHQINIIQYYQYINFLRMTKESR